VRRRIESSGGRVSASFINYLSACRVPGEERIGWGFTQDLSSRGAKVWTDLRLSAGELVEMTLVMPSEITLSEEMDVRCRVRVVRRDQAEAGKEAFAVRIEHYDFPLPRNAFSRGARPKGDAASPPVIL